MGTWAVLESCNEVSNYFDGSRALAADSIAVENKYFIPLLWLCLFEESDLKLYRVIYCDKGIYSSLVDSVETSKLESEKDTENKIDNIEYFWTFVTKKQVALQRLAHRKEWLYERYDERISQAIDDFLIFLSKNVDEYLILDSSQFALNFGGQDEFWDRYLQANLEKIFDQPLCQEIFKLTYQIPNFRMKESKWRKLKKLLYLDKGNINEDQFTEITSIYTFEPLWQVASTDNSKSLNDDEFFNAMVGWDVMEQLSKVVR